MRARKENPRRVGDWRYLIQYRDPHGKRVRETLHVGTLGEARKILAARRTDVDRGTYRGKGDGSGETFAQFAARFLRDHPTRSTYYADMLSETGAIMQQLGALPLAGITAAVLDRFRAERLKVVSPSTVRKQLVVVGTMLRCAQRWGLVGSVPTIQKPSEPTHRDRYLSAGEYARLDRAAPPWLRGMIGLAVATGLRLGEITSLTWGAIDRKARTLHVATNTKTGHRAVPLTTAAEKLLDAQVRHVKVAHVFVGSTGEHYDTTRRRNEISKAVRGLMHGLGLDGASFHTLRHTCGSWLVQAGVSLFEVQQVLGHSDPRLTARYAHLRPDHLRGAAAALDAALAGCHADSATAVG